MARLRTSLLALLVAALLAVPAIAVAEEASGTQEDTSTAAPAAEEEATAEEATAEPAAVITIPVLGSDLVVTVSLDDEGSLGDVALDPASDFEAHSTADHKMTFASEETGVVVKVAAKHGAIGTKVKVDDAEALVGPGTWTGDVFGTGDIATVNYTISVDGAGMPNVTVDESVDFDLAGAEIEVKQGELETSSDEVESTAKVEFEYDGSKRKLKITAMMETKDEGTRVGLKITLSGDKPDDVKHEEPDQDDKPARDERADGDGADKDKSDKKPKKDKSDKKSDNDSDESDESDESDDRRSDDDSTDRDDHRKDD